MQKIKSIVKKIGAISIGAAMLGSTMTGALAASLADYPTPFVDLSAKKYDFLAVVGADASADDNIGVTAVVSGLSAAKVPGTSSGGTVSVSGGVSEDIPVGKNIADKNQLEKDMTDSQIPSLLDTTITFQGSDYDVSEHVELGVFNLLNTSVETGLSTSDDDYADGVVMEANADSIKYYYAFDEQIQVNKTTSSDALEMKFLGKNLKITSIDSATKFTANVGSEYYLQVGDVVTAEGKEVKLVDVGSGGSVIVSVGGVQDTISADSTKTINGVEIKNDDTFYTTKESAKSAAWLVVGKDATESYIDSDPFIGEDEDDPLWIWDIGNLNANAATIVSNAATAEANASNGGPFIGVELDHNYRDGSDEEAVEMGSCIDLPNNYVSVCLDSLTVSADDYMDLKFQLFEGTDLTSDSKVPGLSSVNGVFVEAENDDGIKLLSGSTSGLTNITVDKETDRLWLLAEHVFYYDKDLKKKTYAGNATNGGAGFAQIVFGDTKSTNLLLNRSVNNTGTTEWSLSIEALGDTTDDLVANFDSVDTYWTKSNTTGAVNQLGVTKSSEEAGEVQWQGNNLGTKDEDHRTRYGVIIKDPKSNGVSDEVQFMIPSDQVQANVVVKGGSGAVSGTTTTGQALATFAGAAPDAVLDTQVTNTADHNLILVGGPAVNRLSAQFLGLTYPAFGAASGLSPGEAILSWKANGDKAALIVAGWEAADTRRAATVLKNFDAYKSQFTGTEVKVTGTSSSPTIVSSA